MIRCLNYPKSVYYFIFETSLPQIIHHLSSFFQYSGRKRFLCTSEGDTELGNISSKTKLSWKYDSKVGDTYGLDYQVLIAFAVSQA